MEDGRNEGMKGGQKHGGNSVGKQTNGGESVVFWLQEVR